MKRFAIVAMAIAIAWIATRASAQEPVLEPRLPLSNAPSGSQAGFEALSYSQQIARFESDQRILRMQWNKWIGHEPLRPSVNASYMSNGLRQYYIPSRGLIVTAGPTRAWYW